MPIVSRVTRALSRRLGLDAVRAEPDYETAARACAATGYEDRELVDVIVRKTQAWRDRLATRDDAVAASPSMMMSVAALLTVADAGGVRRVIDFGGAAGAHYFIARALIPRTVPLRWTVVETPEMARRAGAALSNGELDFVDDLEQATQAPCDLLHSSGTLQCVADPRAVLERLLRAPARALCLSRLGLATGTRDVIAVHRSTLSMNGIGPLPQGVVDRTVAYPFVFMPREVFEARLATTHVVRLRMDDPSGAFAVRGAGTCGFGVIAVPRVQVG
jgi:putative methyltransferase (TIGR04325 family)